MASHNQKLPFPPPAGPYKVNVNEGDWKAFKAARLQISMNNPKHTGDKFMAEAEWAAARFESVQLIVSDTLHRYNIMASHNLDEKEAHDLAIKIGDKWLVDNAQAIALLPNKEITRWDDWLNRPKFAANHWQIIECYSKQSDFARLIDATAEKFVNKKGVPPGGRRDDQVNLSCRYLLEEIAAFGVMQDEAFKVDVRPGSPLKPVLDLLKAGTVTGTPEGCKKIQSVIIDFTRNKAFKPK